MIGLLAVAAGIVLLFVGWSIGRVSATRSSRSPAGQAVTAHPGEAEQANEGPTIADVFDAHPAGVVIADSDGAIAYRNLAIDAWSGTHAGVLLDEAIERRIRSAAEPVDSVDAIEIHGPPKIVLAIDARRLRDGSTVVFVDDITERRRVEKVRTDFVANISHELKTPIGALSVLAETLDGVDDPATTDRLVGRMLGEAERASRMIDALMELSRIESGGDQVVEPVPIVDIVDDALERVTELVARSNIDVTVLMPTNDVDGDVRHWFIDGDRRQLVSAFGNLVENAVKYSEPGGAVQIRVRRDERVAELMVADQGPGIPQRDLDRVFERFYRVDRARSRATGGTGLGLSIVRHVATNHHGEVTVASEEGQGSTFSLRLPMRVSASPASERPLDSRV